MWRGLGRGSVCGALIGFGFGPDVNIGAAVGVGRVGVGAVSRSGSVFGVVGRGRADYIGEVRGGRGGADLRRLLLGLRPLGLLLLGLRLRGLLLLDLLLRPRCIHASVKCGQYFYTACFTSPAYAQRSHWVYTCAVCFNVLMCCRCLLAGSLL